MALGSGGAWPADCLAASATLRRAAAGVEGASLDTLDRAVSTAVPHVEGFVRGEEDGDAATAWTEALDPVHQRFSRWVTAQGAALSAPIAGARSPVATVVQDVAPLPLTAASVFSGASAAGGTLTVMFREASASRVCRTRDRGATLRCRTLADDAPRGIARGLIEHDRAEALVLFERAGAQRVEALDVPDVTAFSVAGRLVTATVVGDTLYGATVTPAGPATLRVRRANAPSVRASTLSFERGAAVVHGADASVHQVFSMISGGATPTLGAQLAGDAATAWTLALAGPPVTFVRGCQGDAVGYVAASDGAQTTVVAFDRGAPRELGRLSIAGAALRLSCDDAGVALHDGERVAWCPRGGACDAVVSQPGLLSVLRAGSSLWGVTRAAAGALRIWRGERFSTWRPLCLADDAAHGGISAERAWLAPAGERVVLLTQGAVNMVLSTEDGRAWRSAREAD